MPIQRFASGARQCGKKLTDGEPVPVGQKILLADDEEEWPILELRNIQIAIAQTAS